ncbi:unnamed protein product [Schistosoma mattheei]|uniref:Uncharacterized protein n=1 Tax=Schistosoma mattheei TaxID=31246 RepID=A0A183NV06_9TREM|nr:unnamed protein product [Schistosoma mattheei]
MRTTDVISSRSNFVCIVNRFCRPVQLRYHCRRILFVRIRGESHMSNATSSSPQKADKSRSKESTKSFSC